MTRPTCRKCGEAIGWGETYLRPTKDTFEHQHCPRPLDRLGKALKRYVAPAIVLSWLVVRRPRSGFEIVRAMNAQEAARARRERFAARLWVYVNVLLSLVLAGFVYLALVR